MAKIEKAKFWTGVLYPENMREDWQEVIGDVLQVPYAYCIHNKDKDTKSEHRKDHLHLIIAFSNTTTYQHALNVMDLLSKKGQKALNTCKAVISIRNMYDYLIHDTDSCKKQGKEIYNSCERITGNNFDIGAFEQLGIAEKNQIFVDMSNAIRKYNFTNYMDFYEYVIDNFQDANYIEIMRTHSGHFERMTKGNWHRFERSMLQNSVAMQPNGAVSPSQARVSENIPNCCPFCGSISIKKNGATSANKPRMRCKDCGKSFIF